MDFGAPVAQNVNIDPNKGLQTLSALVGLKQQQQDLATGAINQQRAQAANTVDQQKAQELQAVGNLTKNAYSSGRYKNPDGSFNNQLFANDVAQVAPVNGQAIANDATVRAGEIYSNQKTLFGLNSERRQQIGNAAGALAADPNVNHSQVIDTIEQLREQQPNDKDYSRMLTSVAASIPPDASGPQLQQILRNVAVMTNAPSSAQTDQTPVTMQGRNGLQVANTNPQAVGGVGTRGAPLPQGLSPTDQPGYKATVAGVTANAAARAGGVAGSDIDRSNQISQAQQPASASIRLSQEVDSLADQIGSGKLNEAVSKAAGALGISPEVYARQLLEKNLGQLKAQATASAPSDTARNTITSGFPEATSAPQTIHGAMDYIRGAARQTQARGAQLNAYREKDPSLAGFQHADDILTSRSDPLMHEYMALPAGTQRQAFLKRNFHSAQEAQAFVDQTKGAQHVLGP